MDKEKEMTINRPRASIVVLCYKGLKEVTQPCIASILDHTPANEYELIVVDNASGDGTAEWVKEIAAQYPHIVPVLNDVNRGYAGGNNDGMLLASGDHIILLNNDTLVTPGWLHQLLHLFQENPKVGLIGPVTNSAGNEQRIEIPGLTEFNYKEASQRYVERHRGVWFKTEKLGFFCVAMRRTLCEKLGYLDENFGVGMFEDDDYCLRVKKAGFILAVIEDCFIYHKGSVSFKKLAFDDYRSLFNRNRSYFFQKHNIEWSLSELAFAYLDKFSADLSILKEHTAPLPPEIERIQVRIENFRHLLIQIYDAEIAARREPGNSAGGGRRSLSPSVKRALWHTRARLFSSMVLHGNWRDRLDFLRKAVNYFRRRLLPSSSSAPVAQEVLSPLPTLAAIRDAHPSKKVVIFPATIDFNYMEQRPQQLARAFAEAGYLVFYCTLNHTVDQIVTVELVARNLYLLHEKHLHCISDIFNPGNCIYYCLWPNNIKHLDYLRCAKIIYDYMDELSLLELHADDIEREHRTIINRADLITVSSEQLLEKLPADVRYKTLLLPNAVADSFIDAIEICNSIPDELAGFGNSTPIFGYYGAIAGWLDFALLGQIAKAFPAGRIVLIGPVMGDAEQQVQGLLTDNENVLVLPPIPQLDLVPFLKRFDICMIPFIKNEVTDAVSPVKLFEYFAANKPVVTTALRECHKYPSVRVAHSHTEFIKQLETCLEGKDELSPSQLIARSNTWHLRVNQVIRALSDGVPIVTVP